MKSKVEDCLVWTENGLQLLKTTTDFKAKKAYEWINLECVKGKYTQILSIFVSNLPLEGRREYFQHIEGIFSRKIELLPKSNSFVTNMEKL